jgi:hypothetical protein
VLINALAVNAQNVQQPAHPCKRTNVKVDAKVIVAAIESYRRKETPVISSANELINCTEAFPILKKYVLDPDPDASFLLSKTVDWQKSPVHTSTAESEVERGVRDRGISLPRFFHVPMRYMS